MARHQVSMSDHPSDEDPKAATGSEPVTKQPEASTDDKRVPLGEHVETRQQLAAAKKELETLKAKLAETAKPEPKPQEPGAELVKAVKDLQRRDQLREIQNELDLNQKQAAMVADLMAETGLSATEAKNIAAMRDSELFAAEDRSGGFDPSTHGMGRPARGTRPDARAPEEPDTAERIAFIEKTAHVNRKTSMRYRDNLLGSIAAQQVGRPGHERLPLPKTKQ